MREIRVSMREILGSYRKVYFNDLLKSLTPSFWLISLVYTHWYTKYGIVHFVLKVVDSQNFLKWWNFLTEIVTNVNHNKQCRHWWNATVWVFTVCQSTCLPVSQSLWNFSGPAVLTGRFTCVQTRIAWSHDRLSGVKFAPNSRAVPALYIHWETLCFNWPIKKQYWKTVYWQLIYYLLRCHGFCVCNAGISTSVIRAFVNAELRVLVNTFFPWDAWFSLGGSSVYACFFSRHALKIQ